MDTGTEGFRDCVMDVLALVQASSALQDGTADREQVAENVQVILDNADLGGCVRVAASIVATQWKMLAENKAAALGTDPAAELEIIFADFRAGLEGRR